MSQAIERKHNATAFDYRRAWEALARPDFEALSAPVRYALALVLEHAADLAQTRGTLEMPWPNVPGFREAFRAIPTEELARAARVVYFYGHWSPRGDSYAGNGGTWKFSHYADQELRERLGVNLGGREGTEAGVRLVEGYLRVFFSTPDLWTWEEVGPATPELLEACRRIATSPSGPYRGNREKFDAAADRVMAAARALRDPADKYADTSAFMSPECSARFCYGAAEPGEEECAKHRVTTGRGRDV